LHCEQDAVQLHPKLSEKQQPCAVILRHKVFSFESKIYHRARRDIPLKFSVRSVVRELLPLSDLPSQQFSIWLNSSADFADYAHLPWRAVPGEKALKIC
jgi:hypothetical protein